jgi:hypothetical protein
VKIPQINIAMIGLKNVLKIMDLEEPTFPLSLYGFVCIFQSAASSAQPKRSAAGKTRCWRETESSC